MSENIEGVFVTPLSTVKTDGGDVLHAMKASSQGFIGFGEAYFSTIDSSAVKAWKRHHKMTLNLVVPVGSIKFVIFDDRMDSKSYNTFQEIVLSRNENYCRLTVPPMVWMGFQGIDEKSSVTLNISNIEHFKDTVDRKEISQIEFDWGR